MELIQCHDLCLLAYTRRQNQWSCDQWTPGQVCGEGPQGPGYGVAFPWRLIQFQWRWDSSWSVHNQNGDSQLYWAILWSSRICCSLCDDGKDYVSGPLEVRSEMGWAGPRRLLSSVHQMAERPGVYSSVEDPTVLYWLCMAISGISGTAWVWRCFWEGLRGLCLPQSEICRWQLVIHTDVYASTSGHIENSVFATFGAVRGPHVCATNGTSPEAI